MYSGKLVFAQVMDHLPMHTFRQAVRRYGGDRYVKSFPCHSQFLCMAFAQLTYRESLRDIEVCMRAPAAQALSLGHSQHGVAQHAGQREQAARLANLRRGRAGVDSHCTADVRRRGPGTGSRQHGVCPGRFDHRSVSVRVSVGPVPVHESRGQAPHAARPARPDSDVPACVRRQNGRCSRARPLHPRAWGLLCDGSCVSGLRAPARPGGIRRVLRHPRKVQHAVPPSVLSAGRQDDRSSL